MISKILYVQQNHISVEAKIVRFLIRLVIPVSINDKNSIIELWLSKYQLKSANDI